MPPLPNDWTVVQYTHVRQYMHTSKTTKVKGDCSEGVKQQVKTVQIIGRSTKISKMDNEPWVLVTFQSL